jgi:hypothetical protein
VPSPELPSFAESLRIAFGALIPSGSDGWSGEMRLSDIDARLQTAEILPAALLAEAALASSKPEAVGRATTRESLRFVVAEDRDRVALTFGAGGKLQLDPHQVREAVDAANAAVKVIHDVSEAYDVSLFAILGMRNLSSFVGEILKDQLARIMSDDVLPNPNQDGHPDLLALTSEARAFLDDLDRRGAMSAKEHFSPFVFGGVEVKATCGDTPPARVLAKPKIGERRLPILKGLNWKAHHRATNHLIALVWDFVDGIPTILAAFYRNDLEVDDWGSMVTPGEGSRTTSVSIMNGGGVRKMGVGWIVLPEDSWSRSRILDVMRVPRSF